MTASVLQASLTVTVQAIGGPLDLTPYVLDVVWNHSADSQVADATLTLTDLPTGVERWREVTITAGAVGSNVAQRFGGYLGQPKRNFYPPTWQVAATGYLGLAERIKALSDQEALAQDQNASAGNYGTVTPTVIGGTTYYVYTPPSADTSSNASYQAPGVDLTNAHAGQTDAQMIAQVLAACGLTSKLGSIGGTGRVLGTLAYDQFVWRRSQTALDCIKALDAVSLGFKTVDTPSGLIQRLPTGPRTPASVSAVAFTEGVDINPGATATPSAKPCANRVSVSGWDDGTIKRVAVATGAAGETLPSGFLYVTNEYQSRLLEKSRVAEPGDGLSCEEVALWHLRDDSRLWVTASFTTWRDDSLEVGMQVSVEAAHLGLSGACWVSAVSGGVSRARVFQQTVTVVAAFAAGTEALLGASSATLPMSLAVNP